MKSLVALITVVLVGGVAHATEMVEVPPAPPYMPPPEPTLLDKQMQAANNVRFAGVASLALGTILEGSALVLFLESPCTHDCFLDPVQPEARAPIAALVVTGIGGVAAGLPLAIGGGSHLRKLRGLKLLLHAGSGVAVSGRF